ncbi:MAG: YIP1 family protein [Gemmatimonadota bacterium]
MSDMDDQVSDQLRDEPPTADRADPEIPALPARLAQVVFSPGALFERLRERPVWLGALLTAVVLSVVANLLIPEELIRQLIMEQMPDDADPSGVKTALRIAGILRLVGPIVFPPLLAVFLAAVVLLIYNLLAGGEASFAQAMSATSHVLFIPTLGGLLTVPLILAAGDAQVTLGLHLLVPGLDPEGFAYHFLHGLNFFGLWAAVVLGIAVSRIYRRRSAGSSMALFLSLYGVMVVMMAAVAALTG